MSFWDKMLQVVGVSDQKKSEQQEDLNIQLQKALDQYEVINGSSDYIDPEIVEAYETDYASLFRYADNRNSSIFFKLRWTEENIDREGLKRFQNYYSTLSGFVKDHNKQTTEGNIVEAFDILGKVEGRNLDKQQMECIVKEVHNHLVLAGAGTGKTTTIVGLVKYLLSKGKYQPHDLLVLSFTNASAAEMAERLQKETKELLNASTFHKLGLNIITAVECVTPKIYAEDPRVFVNQQVSQLTQDKAYLRKLIRYITHGALQVRTEFDFTDEKSYQDYLKQNLPTTLCGEVVKSYGELEIANYLFEHGIKYEYEAEYPVDTRTSEYGQYHPDFFLPEYGIYIEYFGINRKKQVPSYFKGKNGKDASVEYLEGIHWKRNLHKENHTNLIEMFAYEMMENTLLQSLENRLKEQDVKLQEIDIGELWEIVNRNKQRIYGVTELFSTVITLIKSNDSDIDDIRQRNQDLKKDPSIEQLLELVEPIYERYQRMLADAGLIDFNDMINKARKYVEEGKYNHPYKMVIVDEYQDISQARYRLLQAMREQKDYNLFCVGDDWQSIYRFSGSDIGFILNFEKYWGRAEIDRIETTYRFPQSLIDVSSSFIMKNPEQKQKALRSAVPETGFSMEIIHGYTEEIAIGFMTGKLDDLPEGASVLFLGRYNFDFQLLGKNQSFKYRFNNVTKQREIRYTKRPDLKIVFMTVHTSKGLQADYVFVLNNKRYGMGFPSKIIDNAIMELLLDNSDHYPFSEERRLYYVAITRAKKKVFLLTVKGNESGFIEEIKNDYDKQLKQAQYTCPLCGGRLIKRNGKNGPFFGCSNYAVTGCRYIRNIKKNTGG